VDIHHRGRRREPRTLHHASAASTLRRERESINNGTGKSVG
jgi:hypothetical protein